MNVLLRKKKNLAIDAVKLAIFLANAQTRVVLELPRAAWVATVVPEAAKNATNAEK